ncbi:D-alanyl-D-alanine carboxypeptidase family protein [Streptomyces sp. NPDC046939]|uniref:D-alanyl-D-alanine carboxypeptidase family protein n=1 Tax=Streptomyces sp. NPDC046939 TaxID=3155376 RepID=UPI0033F010A4
MHRTPRSAHTRSSRRRCWPLVVIALIAVVAATATVVGLRTSRPASTSAPPPSTAGPSKKPAPRASPEAHRGPPDEADGVVPDGVTVFDTTVPAVTRLDPGLRDALRRAARAAGGIVFHVNSGWRSPAYQNQLLREAVAKYGSEDEAARWVATAATSPHVSGDAVDLGRSDATAWLAEHGAAYGLCPVYRNEPWHYELRTAAIADGCPALYADPTEDPRMRQ